jgi:hypothetical protein
MEPVTRWFVLDHTRSSKMRRVASKNELTERMTAGIKDVNRRPVIHTWSYKLAEAV